MSSNIETENYSYVFLKGMGKIRGKWKEKDMVIAVRRVMNNEITIREASTRFSVSKSTLAEKIKKLKASKEV